MRNEHAVATNVPVGRPVNGSLGWVPGVRGAVTPGTCALPVVGVPPAGDVLPVAVEPDVPELLLRCTAQLALVIVFVSNVTAPLRASRRPWKVAPVVAVIEVNARTLPTNREPVTKVAELPICQTTLQACAPFTRRTLLLDAVINVDSVWKTNCALASPLALRVRVPVNPNVGLA